MSERLKEVPKVVNHPTKERNDMMIAKMEKFTRAIRKGRIKGIGIVLDRFDGSFTSYFDGSALDKVRISGCLSHLIFLINQSIDEQSDGTPLPEFRSGE